MTSKITLLVLFVFSMLIMSFKSDNRKKKILFFGDSITEMGVQPGGYISLINERIKNEGLNDNYETIGAGVSGNKIYDLYLRLEEDVLAKQPDIVVIFIGVNDVWHKVWGTGTDYDKFGKFYERIVKKLKEANIKVIVCTPGSIGEMTDFSNSQDGDLNAYSNWIRGFAYKNTLPLIDLRKLFHEYDLANNPQNLNKGILTIDGVHLNATGNELVAKEMWKTIKEIK